MDAEVLQSMGHRTPSKLTALDLDSEDGSTLAPRRRKRTTRDLLMEVDPESDEDTSSFRSVFIDPETLCPWCDERLPPEPTPHLRRLIEAAKRVSRQDERATNSLGLQAPLVAYVGVCQRHRFERDWIPRAREQRWPTEIDFDKLAGRVQRLEGTLKTIVDDVDEDFAPTHKRCATRARKENEFWQEVVRNVRKQGSRHAVGVRGQFSSFSKTQPGYYGELGYVIIHQTLCDLFPPSDFHPDASLPLTPTDFIALVLVPETAVRLIIDDLNLSRPQAIATLEASAEYGVAMFPADDTDGDPKHSAEQPLGATERMFMARARARRKELEEEERLEAE
ncbi:RTC4-like domain-containing protein, partial [Epithele typhae]|uniref:RTC4-like domain-containing protein n=1 Tax=Epithele typhae TaxID=378194 RepID=UPI00200735E7